MPALERYPGPYQAFRDAWRALKVGASPGYLQGVHEEADTLIAFHVCQQNGNVIVRASDTDVLIILLAMMAKRVCESESC